MGRIDPPAARSLRARPSSFLRPRVVRESAVLLLMMRMFGAGAEEYRDGTVCFLRTGNEIFDEEFFHS